MDIGRKTCGLAGVPSGLAFSLTKQACRSFWPTSFTVNASNRPPSLVFGPWLAPRQDFSMSAAPAATKTAGNANPAIRRSRWPPPSPLCSPPPIGPKRAATPPLQPTGAVTADRWNACIEGWLYVTDTDLARRIGVDGYYAHVLTRPGWSSCPWTGEGSSAR